MRRLVLACFVLVGCGSEDELASTRQVDSGYVVTEVSVTDTGTAPVDSSVDGSGDTGTAAETAVVDSGDDATRD